MLWKRPRLQNGVNSLATRHPLPSDLLTLHSDTLRSVAQALNRNIQYHQCNVRSEEDVTKVFAKFTPTLKTPIRGLVACAGVSDNGPATDFPADSFRRLLDINVTGTFMIAKAVANEVIKANVSASFVFVASMSGYVSNKVSRFPCIRAFSSAYRYINKGVDTAGYNSSKAAVHQLARSLAAEWGSRVNVPLIRVNSLSPGYIRTAATAEALQKPGMESQWVGDNMLYRLSTVDEFRAPVLFLLGGRKQFHDGGRSQS